MMTVLVLTGLVWAVLAGWAGCVHVDMLRKPVVKQLFATSPLSSVQLLNCNMPCFC